MYKRLILIALLACLPMAKLAQSFGVVFVSGGAVGAAVNPTVIVCQMDFEDDGCEDGDSADSCDILTSAYQPNCAIGQHADAPITGTFSGCTLNDGGSIFMDFLHDDDACAETSKVTVDFKFKWVDDDESAVTAIVAGAKKMGGGNFAHITIREANNKMDFFCGSDGNTANWAVVIDTVYNIRMNLDGSGSNYDCTLYVDLASSNNWGVGGIKSSGLISSTDSSVDIDGFFHYDTSSDISSITDDIGICDAVGGYLATGTQCKR